MNRNPAVTIFSWFILASLLLSSCANKRRDELLATINVARYGNPQEETQVALGVTQTAVEAIIQSASTPPALAQPTITPTTLPTATSTNIPTSTTAPAAIPASQASITCGEFEFHIDRLGVDNTMQGLAPSDMPANTHILFVEFELLSGAQEAFEALTISISSGSGQRSEPIARISDGRVYVLSSLTMTGESGQYEPGADHIVWAYVVPKNADVLYLNFPTGEVIDLSHLM